MNILVDCTPFLNRPARGDILQWKWLQAVRTHDPSHTVACFPWLDLPPQDGHPTPNHASPAILARKAALHAYMRLPQILRNFATPRADLFHVSPSLRRFPTHLPVTATLAAIECWWAPETQSPAFCKAQFAFAEAIRSNARGLIVPSDAARRDAIRLLKIPDDKLVTVPYGIAAPYFGVGEAEAARVRNAFSLPARFALFASAIEYRMNLARLLNVWQALPADLLANWQLVVAGPIGWSDAVTVQRIRHSPEVRYLGDIAEADLPGLCHAASLFVYPVLHEGSGLPALRALATGCPVLAANTAALPEVCGEGALYVDPLSELELSTGLRFLLEDEQVRTSLGLAGQRHVRRFTWQASAAKSLAFFERILD